MGAQALNARFSRLPYVPADKKLSASDWRVLHALGRYANQGGVAWPKMQTLAEDTGIARPNIARAIKRLETHGILSRHNPTRGGRSRVNRYTLHYAPPEQIEPCHESKTKPKPETVSTAKVIQFPSNVIQDDTRKVTAQSYPFREELYVGGVSVRGGNTLSPRGGLARRAAGWLRGWLA